MKQPRQTMKATDLFEIEKVQIFDMETGDYIGTIKMYDSNGDTKSIEEYTPEVEQESINTNQLELF